MKKVYLIKESINDVCYMFEDDMLNNDTFSILQEFKCSEPGSTKTWELIDPKQYQAALRDFSRNGEVMRFPESIIDNWIGMLVRNISCLKAMTDLAGHSPYFPIDDLKTLYYGDDGDGEYDEFIEKIINEDPDVEDYKYEIKDLKNPDPDDYGTASAFLDYKGFYDWCKLPDGSDAWSDYGLSPMMEILSEWTPNSTAAEKLLIINRIINVVHCRGDLSTMFVKGGTSALNAIENDITINESLKSKRSANKVNEALSEVEGLSEMELNELVSFVSEEIGEEYDDRYIKSVIDRMNDENAKLTMIDRELNDRIRDVICEWFDMNDIGGCEKVSPETILYKL